ncbi:hypothetical protein [Bradyrhizobium sp. LTSP857]|uniref:hypothetical protein n=1 Tax=Bradyrhizobium sp. LTSP857 TaxID=1619231 RepID=UPI000AB22150|nr:hypothetical protein [Bradyrhizobium sp. LTSP857]
MRFEILPGLPPYGPMAISFTQYGEREHREGLVVRFYPRMSEPWVGNFLGSMTACTGVFEHPNKSDFIVVVQGAGCIVDPEHRVVRDHFASDIKEIFPLPSIGSIAFRRLTNFIALKADNSKWDSPRISWDDFRNIEVHDCSLVGEAYTPIGDAWVPFQLDLLTGDCHNGIYAQDMARAVPVQRRWQA